METCLKRKRLPKLSQSFNQTCQSVHSYIPMSLLQCLSFGPLHTFCFQKSKVQRWITRHLRFLLLMSGHPLVSDANYNPRGQARRHFVTWDDNEPSGGWWLMIVLGICFTCFFHRSMIDERFRWTSCLFSRQDRSIGWCRKLSMTGINTSGFWDVFLFMYFHVYYYWLLEYFFQIPFLL